MEIQYQISLLFLYFISIIIRKIIILKLCNKKKCIISLLFYKEIIMASYVSDGKKLINVEYDIVPELNDMIDGMRVISTNKRAEDEYAVFLQALNHTVCCYVFDEIFIVGKVDGFENLVKALEAWHDDEI